MSEPLDLDGCPACPECGALMRVAEWPGEGLDGASLWSAACIVGGDCHWEVLDRTARPTWRTEPGFAPLVAEIERMRAERQAILDAGGELLWAGGAKTIPEAVAGALHVLYVALTRSTKEYDASPAAKVRDVFPHLVFTDADLVRWAVERAGKGEYRRQRWAVVGEIFTRGSHVARELCRACGLDPYEMVGDDGEGEE